MILKAVRDNKIHTYIIILGFFLIISLVIYFICYYLNLGTLSVVIALSFSIITSVASYYNCDKMVLAINGARPATEEQDKLLSSVLDGLCIASGLPRPKLYVINDPSPNAFATGRNPENAVICVTTGLLEKLDYYELEGVVAHELSHIKNYDIRLSAVVSVMVGFIVMLSDWTGRALFWGRGRDRDNDNKGNAILMLIGLLCVILAPIFGQLMQLALSRRREYLADSTAVEFTRNPDGLISALQKLDADSHQLKTANNSTAHMYIVSPFKANKNQKQKTSLFSTHPSIDDRIEALRNLK